MKKKFIYKDQVFNMSVSFNTTVARTPDGPRLHTLSVFHQGSSWHKTKEISDDNIKEEYEKLEAECRQMIDGDIPDQTTLLFASLGFE